MNVVKKEKDFGGKSGTIIAAPSMWVLGVAGLAIKSIPFVPGWWEESDRFAAVCVVASLLFLGGVVERGIEEGEVAVRVALYCLSLSG